MLAASAQHASRRGEDPVLADPLPVVRRAVRDVLEATPEYAALPTDQRRALASAMVRVGCTAANLIREEVAGENALTAPPLPPRPIPSPVAARALSDPEIERAASRVADTTRAILNAVSFPRFVTDLINGVFKAMNDSNQTQLESYINLLNAVAASTEGFADANMGPARARQWILSHYPDAYELESDLDPLEADASPEERTEHEAEQREIKLQPRSGGKPPPEAAVRADLGLTPSDTLPSLGNPESGLVPLVRSRLAQMRQEMLATLVQMGMQRIVIDSGRISASMRFHIDTRDAVAHDDASRFGMENEIAGSGSFGYGPWGVSASARNTVSYVSTQKNQSTSELNTDLDLNSAVEINFRTDYLPLNKLANSNQASAINANSRNPNADADAAREKRIADARSAETRRSDSLTDLLKPSQKAPLTAPTPPPPQPEEGKQSPKETKSDTKAPEPKADGKTDPPKPDVPVPKPPETGKGGEGGGKAAVKDGGTPSPEAAGGTAKKGKGTPVGGGNATLRPPPGR